MLSLLAAAALFSGVAVANAAEPVALSNSQLDQVSAGRMGGGNYNSGTVVYAIQFGAGSTGRRMECSRLRPRQRPTPLWARFTRPALQDS
ncbi:MAG: hypothetical protein HWD60_11815 [Defluviicoccus sp.]|nr:MAG: hypothetical protein HWD60_11815 [Defluviicoccus sp.]